VPDLHNAGAFKKLLLSAKSIVYVEAGQVPDHAGRRADRCGAQFAAANPVSSRVTALVNRYDACSEPRWRR